MLVPVLLAYAVLPFGRNMTVADYDAGLLFFFAVGGGVELAVFMAGWSSHNKYSLLGAMRAIAQMISYEIPLILSAVTVVMIVGSLKLTDIVAAQNHYTFGLAHWFVFTPWGLVGFILFFIASLAEANRSPFDLPEAESELTGGYHTEYSSMKFAMFFMAEYANMINVGCVATLLFLGGWTSPFGNLIRPPANIFVHALMPIFWFVFKVFCFLFLYVWVRGTLPRFRYDQLMNFGWRVLLPLAMLNIVGTSLWLAYR
jgi:NADH-quinone oxidoreductase subunit H